MHPLRPLRTAIWTWLWIAAPAWAGGFDIGAIDLTQHIASPGTPDGIPALTNPVFVSPDEVSYLADDDLVLGVYMHGVAKAYPENFGWRHEIINDEIGGRFISVTFCPLTGTGLNFNTTDGDGRQFELRVSGLLINSNLVMYDRRDRKTLYPQMIYTAINGSFKGERLELLPVIETTWALWKKFYPDSTVPKPDTGWEIYGGRSRFPLRFYISYPYYSSKTGDYRYNDGWLLHLPTTNGRGVIDRRFPTKDTVLGICHNDQVKAYPFATMARTGGVINDRVGGLDLLVIFDSDSRTAIPYSRRVRGHVLSFYQTAAQGTLPVEFADVETGTLWNMLGQAVAGPLRGAELEQVPAYNSMWFAWAAYWPETAIWQGEGIIDPPATAVEEERSAQQPLYMTLAQNAPNPFNAETRIQYALPAPEKVRLIVYNTAGQQVRLLVDGYQQPGVYLLRWDGRNEGGDNAASGAYIYRLELPEKGRVLTKRMALIR